MVQWGVQIHLSTVGGWIQDVVTWSPLVPWMISLKNLQNLQKIQSWMWVWVDLGGGGEEDNQEDLVTCIPEETKQG